MISLEASFLARRLLAASLVLAPLVAASSASAQALPKATKLDPGVLRVLRTGGGGPLRRGVRHPGTARVFIELDRAADANAIAELERMGASVVRVDGAPAAYGRFVLARVDAGAATALQTSPIVQRIQHLSTQGPPPLDHSAELVRLADARGARPALDLMTGEGITIGDVDTNVDPFHPTMFRGDAGYYDWIDVNGDGVLTPGIDAIDLNHNGMPDPGETAVALLASTVDFYGMNVPARQTSDFDPSTDWLYLDTNRNGSRDYGAPDYDDKTPAFGEPLFVPDDVNRNGRIDVGERLVRLGTSKLKQVYVHLDEEGITAEHVYKRGVDLSTLVVNRTHDAIYGFPDALHATGVITILAGDVPLVGRRWVGFAPDADVLLGWDADQNDELPMTGAMWALNQKPDVMLYELAPWTGSPLDGTDPLSKLIDASEEQERVTQTCPTGDEGSALKHAHVDVSANETTPLEFDLPSVAKGGMTALSYVEVSLNVRSGAAVGVRFTEPSGGAPIDALSGAQGTLSTGATFYGTSQSTERGTQFVDMVLYTDSPSTPLPVGTWKVAVDAGSKAIGVDAYVMDDQSGWSVGAAWDGKIATDTSTVGIPSVADHCIAVGAHPNHVQTSGEPWYDMYYAVYDVPKGFTESQGQVRAYSPQGPRIDLVQKPDVLAPDNPWVAAVHDPTERYGSPDGAFSVFGGTSGASPHVTGTAALLAQAGIRGDAARDAIRKGAVSDATTGPVWNQSYGFGRLDAAGALGVRATGGPPTLRLTASSQTPALGEEVTLTPTAAASDGKTAGLEIKWDDGYDGTWDTPYGPVAPRKVARGTAGNEPYKARVRDSGGRIAEAVIWIDFGESGPIGSGEASATGAGGGHGDTSKLDAGGCGCRSAGESPSPTGLAALSLALGAAAIVRMRRKRA